MELQRRKESSRGRFSKTAVLQLPGVLKMVDSLCGHEGSRQARRAELLSTSYIEVRRRTSVHKGPTKRKKNGLGGL